MTALLTDVIARTSRHGNLPSGPRSFAACRRRNARLLEIGAGTGQDSVFFASHGLDVVATDMSSAMVARCRDKGLDARVIDDFHVAKAHKEHGFRSLTLRRR